MLRTLKGTILAWQPWDPGNVARIRDTRTGTRRKATIAGFYRANLAKGQSGNPAGHSGLYGEVTRLAREASPRAIERLKELMESDDHRVAAVACNSIIDRALGKPREYDPAQEAPKTFTDLSKLSPEDREVLRSLLLKTATAQA